MRQGIIMIKQIMISVVLFFIIGCSLKNNATENNEIVVKYYTQTLVYNDEWYQYKPQYSYYNEAPNDFNISKPFQCDEPGDEVSEVYFKNKKMYQENRPFKVTVYCSKFLVDELSNKKSYVQYITSKQKYDSMGRVISIVYPRLNQNDIFKYTKNTKEVTTSYTDSHKTETSKYIYDDNKKLLKILKYKEGKQVYSYLFDSKDKNILREYDMKGKLTGNIEELNED